MPTPIVYSVSDACAVGGFGRSRAYELIAAGKLDARKMGSRTVITHQSLEAYLAALPAADIKTGPAKRARGSAAA
jgi:excisionase family DNA binding protein